MDESSLEMLEFPKVREILAGYTSFSGSRELALELQPLSDPPRILELLQQSAEARILLSIEPDFSIGAALDVRGAVHMAALGKVLEPQDLLRIHRTLGAARNARRNLRKTASETPGLWRLAEQIVELPDIEREISECLTEAGDVADAASPRLAELRHQLRDTRQVLLARLEAILRSDKGRKYIQDAFIDEREGRYVIPVKVEHQREVKGIVHDVSNTGATVFIEPWSTVEEGNQLRTLSIEEKREVERIMASLSALVGSNEAAIADDVELLARLDLALAKARYAAVAGAVEPAIFLHAPAQPGDECPQVAALRLVNARHPLLEGRAVPLSVEIGKEFSILVITGPNTGGKTVALKTIGLLTLMAQAGLPVPASDGTCIPVFDRVFVDIGDEQSIEQTVSSFSWHTGNVVSIVRDSTERSLVLLDEMGTSTDPNEGAALARAILLHFLSRGTTVVATTHYNELKVFAHGTPGLQNASLDFDPVSLAPTYHLTVGVPGGSNALAIASRLGLPQSIVDTARDMLGKGNQDIELLVADLMKERQRAEDLRRDLENEVEGARTLREQLEKELGGLSEHKAAIIREARESVASEANELQARIREVRSELKRVRSEQKVEEARRSLEAVRERLRSQDWRPDAGRSGEAGAPASSAPAIGERVWLEDVQVWATVLSLPDGDGQIDVQIGQSRLRVNAGDIGKVERPAHTPPDAYPRVKRSRKSVPLELDLRGKRADEVEPALDDYLNDASLAGLSRVRIIHGYGTGTVRQIVRDTLATHPLVKSFRPGEQGEGGDGVTVVEL